MSDQPDQDLRDDRAADLPEALAVAENRRFGEDVVSERRLLRKLRTVRKLLPERLCLLFIHLLCVLFELLRGEHGYVAHPPELPAERASHRLARGHTQ